MKTTKIRIKNLFGITEKELDGRSVEISGTNGAGKSSVLDSIRYALTNNSGREYIIRNGADEGEIIIETDTGLYIDRKKRTEQSDYKQVKENGRIVPGPENFLRQLVTPLQLDPVAFILMPAREQNRTILDLIEFPWDLNWIRQQFGEIPEGVDYEQNILQVLNDIQAENGVYFQERQDINRDIRNKRAIINEIAADIPENYNLDYWEAFDIGGLYREVESIKAENNKIERAKIYKDNFSNKKRGLDAELMMGISTAEKAIENERQTLAKTIERLEAEIKAVREKQGTLDEKLSDKIEVIRAKYNEDLAKLERDFALASEYVEREIQDVTALEEEIEEAEEMRQHINEYKRMKSLTDEMEDLHGKSKKLTEKIELARELPGKILETAVIPVEGLTVSDGIPLINGLPVSNLSDGEKLNLCVDVALSNPNALQIILIDGVERLSSQNREKLYARCKEKGLQFIATRTADSELEVKYL